MVVVVDKIVTSSSSSLFLLFNQTPAPVNKVLYYSPNNSLTSFSISTSNRRRKSRSCLTWALAGDHHNSSSSIGGDAAAASKKKKAVASHSNYMVAFDSSSCITRPLAEILRDLNKRIPDNIIINNNKQFTTTTTTLENDDQLDAAAADQDDLSSKTYIPWYHANRMLSFYAPGWCGEIRDVIFSDNGSVTVVYRVTIRGSDGEAHRESTGTVSPPMDGHVVDVVAAAEEIAFCRACARFGLGLYLYHDE